MLSNHLKYSYNNYIKTDIVPNLSSSIKTNSSQSSNTNQDNQEKNKERMFNQKNKVLSTHEKVSELNKIVHSPSIINTLILKSKFANITHY